MNQLGPLDRRILRKRCVACARRKIKCQGNTPCLYCVKKKIDCIAQATIENKQPVFVNISFPSPEGQAVSLSSRSPTPQTGLNHPQDKLVKFFFSGFLKRNDLGRPIDLETISSSFQKSSSLYNCILALGAFQQSLDSTSADIAKTSKVVALKAYRSSVTSLQIEIEKGNVLDSESSLYTTFFLGLFELMYDVTGEGWIKHILHGTSMLLQLRGPDAHFEGPGRAFFLAIRVFEICRSLLYSEPTFLAEKEWMDLTGRIRDASGTSWRPKEILFDLMIACSSLNCRVIQILNNDSIHSLQDCIVDGHHIRGKLNQWHLNFQANPKVPNTDTNDENNQSLLAITYFHAISIYLSGIFDYRHQFYQSNCPTLSQSVIQDHVDAIIMYTQVALATTNLAGILLFVPLRIAGARVMKREETRLIEGMLREVSKRGFVVADAFEDELREVWSDKGIADF